MSRYKLKVNKHCLYIEDTNSASQLDFEQLVHLLEDRAKLQVKLDSYAELLAVLQESLEFFNRIPQARNRVKTLKDKIQQFKSDLNS